MNTRRGNETPEHRALKTRVGDVLTGLGCLVVFEHCCCDVVAYVPWNRAILGVEIERSSRNVVANVTRNMRNGCDHVAIVVSRRGLVKEISRKLERRLPAAYLSSVSILTRDQLYLLQELIGKAGKGSVTPPSRSS